jgi:hypothetical protein
MVLAQEGWPVPTSSYGAAALLRKMSGFGEFSVNINSIQFNSKTQKTLEIRITHTKITGSTHIIEDSLGNELKVRKSY